MEDLLPGLTDAPKLHPLVAHVPIAPWLVALRFWFWPQYAGGTSCGAPAGAGTP